MRSIPERFRLIRVQVRRGQTAHALSNLEALQAVGLRNPRLLKEARRLAHAIAQREAAMAERQAERLLGPDCARSLCRTSPSTVLQRCATLRYGSLPTTLRGRVRDAFIAAARKHFRAGHLEERDGQPVWVVRSRVVACFAPRPTTPTMAGLARAA